LINAVDEVTRERAQSFLTDEHIEQIVKAYERFADEPGFAHVATREEVRANEGNLSIPLYVSAKVSEAREKGAEYRVEALPAAPGGVAGGFTAGSPVGFGAARRAQEST
jgi:type I restriction enzyme M protein